ncbi:MAG: hypothetical protein ABL866_04220 [Devosia sp.]
MSRRDRPRYSLANYTVELRDKGWYFGYPYDLVGAYRGPYTSIASVTLTIARQLKREIERRHRSVVPVAQAEMAAPE